MKGLYILSASQFCVTLFLIGYLIHTRDADPHCTQTPLTQNKSLDVATSQVNSTLHLSQADLATIQAMIDRRQTSLPFENKSIPSPEKQAENNIKGQRFIDGIISTGQLNPEKIGEVTSYLNEMSTNERQQAMQRLGTAIDQNQVILDPNS